MKTPRLLTTAGMAFSLLFFNSGTFARGADAGPAPAPARARPLGLAINEDDSHFYMSRPASQMTIEGLRAFVDQYAGTRVSHLFLCPNAMKTSFRSRVWDAIWELKGPQQPPAEPIAKTWCENARLLSERGLDPYAVWIARCREKGIVPWLSMRMNDVHNADDVRCYIHSSFWVEHPEYWRVPGSKSGWVERAFDYEIPAVRAHHLALVRELLERYDPDGLELDWMRFGYHFKPGREAEGGEILTRFMQEARVLTREWAVKRGHPILLGARVPTHPDAAKGLGLDGVRWGREGLIDMLVPTPFWASTDFDIPIELWRERLGASAKNLVLAAGAEILLGAYPGAKQIENDIASARGFAAAHLFRGADQIYLFNYMDPEPMKGPPGTYRALLDKGLALDEVIRSPRRHPVTYRDTVPPGVTNNAGLPVDARKGGKLQIYIGPAPTTGRVIFMAGLAQKEGVATAQFEVSVNGKRCRPAPDDSQLDLYPNVVRGVCFECPLEALKDGFNNLEIKQLAPGPDQQLVWAELRI